MAAICQLHLTFAIRQVSFTLKLVDFAVYKCSNRSFIVGSCYHSHCTIAANHSTATVTHNRAVTHDRSRSGYCVAIHTFHMRSCSSRSYYFAGTPGFGSSRTVGSIHNSSRCCILTTVHHNHTTTDLAATTVSCNLTITNHSITIRLKPLAVPATQQTLILRQD